MITSKDCFMKDVCNKYLKDENCECRNCDIFCTKLFKISNMYEKSLIPVTQRKRVNLVLTNYDECDKIKFKRLGEISSDIVNFVKEGKNLYLHSTISGNGKTSWALRLIQSFINKTWPEASMDDCPALVINVPRFLLALKDNISVKGEYVEHIKENIFKADIVLWDDIATKNSTEFESENLLSMIDTRISLGKSNIYTSNMNSEDLYKLLGPRLASRVANMSEDIELNGIDKRNLGR